MNSQLVQEILLLIGVAANEVKALTSPNSTANQAAGVSGDLLSAIQAVLARNQQLTGQPIDAVLKTL